MTVSAPPLRRTPLYECHVEAGARLVPFAGWEMPVQYEGVRAEHLAVRAGCGLFDVSHMGQIETTGSRALEFLDHVLTNDLARVEPGGSQYALMCNPEGGTLDDLFSYRFDEADGDRFLTVVNAANAGADFEWIAQRAREWGSGVEIHDRSADHAMLALQGPEAIAKLTPLADAAIPPRLHHSRMRVAGTQALVCRTGYTGEDGVELLVDPADAATLWRSLISAGAVPAGLAARDTLRLEVCYPLYGNELLAERTPIEAGLGWACALDKDFVGVERLRGQAERGTAEILVPFRLTERGIPRAGCDVILAGERVGQVTSGTLSPSLEVGIGMAYVRADLGKPGRELEIDVRGKRRRVVTDRKPLYRKEGQA